MSSPNMKPIATTPFIMLVNPKREGLSSQQRTVVHSYAARTAHARVRIARVKAYQLSKAIEFQQDLETSAVLMSNSGPGGPGSGRGDPFVSFVRPLTNTDQFLLDQCGWS